MAQREDGEQLMSLMQTAINERTPGKPYAPSRLDVVDLCAGFREHQILKSLTMSFPDRAITAVMGPSGCGKSTFVRCLNCLHMETSGAWVRGGIRLDGQNILSGRIDPVEIRRKVGMVFQRPNPFPSFSIYDNVAIGLKLNGMKNRRELDQRVERSLKHAFLWDEVKDRLQHAGTSLSGGQQQRLCIARALAVEPEILLMDEPCSALDPISTERIEELLVELKRDYTIVMVTHNIQQAARCADYAAFLLLGDLIEHGPASDLFTKPKRLQTEQFISGRFG
jgi:phosphate transport system ATP-binding protein